MQYKIPVQIENDDPIFLGLSLKQLIILMLGWAIAYMIFKGLSPWLWWDIAAIPSIFIFLITLMIVLFKHSEMTFIPFMLNLIRMNLNGDPKTWVKWVDSFEPIEIWYVTQTVEKKKASVDTSEKIEQIEALKDKLNKI
jgi:hypothetical protein